MNQCCALLFACLASTLAQAGELSVSAKEPLTVTAPDQWKSAKDKPPGASFPFETYRLTPAPGHNAMCMVSIYDKGKKEYSDPKFLQKLVRGDSRPYVKSADELPKVELKQLNAPGITGFYANFLDPDLVGKPVKMGDFKTVTPIILCLNAKYLIKVTILCDEIGGADYKEAMKVIESLKAKE